MNMLCELYETLWNLINTAIWYDYRNYVDKIWNQAGDACMYIYTERKRERERKKLLLVNMTTEYMER